MTHDERRSPFSPPPAPGRASFNVSRRTLAITAGRPDPVPDAPLNSPTVFASTYHAGGPIAYGRDGNPTWTALEDAIGTLESGTAVTFASGMAAIAAVLELVPVGGIVVVPSDGFGGTRAFLANAPAGRWETRLVDIADTDAVVAALDGVSLLWIESPTNPKLDVADIPALATAAHERGALVAVDNTYATPLAQQPLSLGADLAVHSVTKLLSGHSDVVLGAVVTHEGSELCGLLRRYRSVTGAVPGPMEAYLALRGVRTLALRLERSEANAAILVARLVGHAQVDRVRYPGLPGDPWHERAKTQMESFGNMVAFEISGGAAAAEAFARSTRLIVHATSLGGIETTIERRARWPGEEQVPPALLRLSVGCEDVEDLWADFEHAFRIAAAAGDPEQVPVELPNRNLQ
jgi:cystathionine gamma-synthase